MRVEGPSNGWNTYTQPYHSLLSASFWIFVFLLLIYISQIQRRKHKMKKQQRYMLERLTRIFLEKFNFHSMFNDLFFFFCCLSIILNYHLIEIVIMWNMYPPKNVITPCLNYPVPILLGNTHWQHYIRTAYTYLCRMQRFTSLPSDLAKVVIIFTCPRRKKYLFSKTSGINSQREHEREIENLNDIHTVTIDS